MLIPSLVLACAQFNQAPGVPLLPELPVAQSSSDELPRRGVLGVAFGPAPTGPGMSVVSVTPGFTGDKAGLKAGDVLLAINGSSVSQAQVGAFVRELPSGKPIRFSLIREGKNLELSTALVPRPKDPGNANYTVEYRHVVSHGKRMRTIITFPKKPGKHPGFFFIQGFSPISYDFTLEGSKGDVTTIDGPLLYEVANANYITIRVEKPGVGDSEGGPFAPMDYTTELDIYRQTLKQLKAIPSVDTENVFIFGHSMGGAFGPMVAAENPVKGISTYGTAARTWFEYLMDTIRYQGLVGGSTFEQADEISRQGARLMALVFIEGKSAEEVKKSHPQLAPLVDSFFPGGLFNGKSLDFWRQLNQTNFPDYWVRSKAYVLSARGESDFVTYDADHKLIADAVNRARPGTAKFTLVPSSDHLFHDFATEPLSMQNFTKGQFNLAYTKLMLDWMAEVRKKPSL